MRVLANPIFLRAALALFCSASAFLLALVLMRKLRRSIEGDANIPEGAASLQALPLHLYSSVIQQLKQQKQELESQSQDEQRRARGLETLSQAALFSLPCGVLVFGANGLLKLCNPAAREILGFASPTGMTAGDIFRGAAAHGIEEAHSNDSLSANRVHSLLRGEIAGSEIEGVYVTPRGEERRIRMTVSPVSGIDGTALGNVCMIDNLNQISGPRLNAKTAIMEEVEL